MGYETPKVLNNKDFFRSFIALFPYFINHMQYSQKILQIFFGNTSELFLTRTGSVITHPLANHGDLSIYRGS